MLYAKMSAKKRKDNLTHIATVREIYLEELSGKLIETALEKRPSLGIQF